MGKLDETSNLLELYMYATGESEIPVSWHQWSCLTLVSAAVGDRVWFRKFEWENLTPNMYTFLVGPSGSGKGGAIGFMQQFIHKRMNPFLGSVTYKSMTDRMASPAEAGCPEMNSTFLIQPELADCIGSGQLANSMIKAMTSWYTPSSMSYQESTRGHGEKSFGPPCLNWLAGTTVEWLRQTVDQAAMLSGFFGRVVIAPDTYDPDRRIYQPYVPHDYDDIRDYIIDQIGWLTNLEGEFAIDTTARLADKLWYETRTTPERTLMPFWKRQHDLKIKLAMILSLCDSMNLTISESHILQAEEMVDTLLRRVVEVVRECGAGASTLKTNQVREVIEREGVIPYSRLLRAVQKWGMNHRELDDILAHLCATEEVVELQRGRGIVYEWRSGHRKINAPGS